MKITRVVYKHSSTTRKFAWRYGDPVNGYVWIRGDGDVMPETRNGSDWEDYVEPPKVGEKWGFPSGALTLDVLAVEGPYWFGGSEEMPEDQPDDWVFRRRLPEREMVRVMED